MQFVKGFYRRPFKNGGDDVQPTGGGRVTELTARPLLAAFYPELGGVRQPLAGEIAARRELLERMAFCTGYAVEIGLLLDVHARRRRSTRIAQVDLDVRQNRHQPLEELTPMAAAVLARVTSRLRREDGWPPATQRAPTRCCERPPLAELRALRLTRLARPSGEAAGRATAAPRGDTRGCRACAASTSTSTAPCSGPAASLLRDADGAFSLLGVRALEACDRAGAEVVLMSGRR